MTRSFKTDSGKDNRYSYTSICFFSLLLICVTIAGPSAVNVQASETWKLIKREYPVMPEVISEVRTGRNAGSFIKLRRTQRRNEILYISRAVVRGQQTCLWVSGFVWNDNLPETINTGREYSIGLQARLDRRQGNGCGMGRISVTFGNRAEPLRDRAPNVVHVRAGLADPDPGGIAPAASTEVLLASICIQGFPCASAICRVYSEPPVSSPWEIIKVPSESWTFCSVLFG